jgi:hypothetical protein
MEIPHLFANVEIPVHAIMRNHLHSILVLRDIKPSSDDRFFRPAKTKTPTKNKFFAGVLELITFCLLRLRL